MATNEVYRGHRTRSLPVTADTKSGSPVIVGGLVGVALTDEGAGGNADGSATVVLGGAYDLSVTAAAAVKVGDKIYIAADYGLSDTDTDTLFGYALKAISSASTATIPVEIAQV